MAESRLDATAAHGTTAPADPTAFDGLCFQRCQWCGTPSFHRLLCPVCASSDMRTEHSAGRGVVRRTTVVHRGTPSARNESLIEMAEGFTVRGRVLGPPAAVHPGDRVQLSRAEDPVRKEPLFQLMDEPYRPWA
ncbi:OB-fold domain-containing protein [Streptomyces sp. NPDC002896]|uniref:Zn-ribbon domain-containing OB-fold protein n=1 Tax=Streptomyces sp. NPDC002896 TaxID=3154438 RepID=UPI0033165AE5